MKSEIKPWGSYEVLYEDDFCKVKKIIVKPQQRLSYQYHVHRKEIWIVTQGFGELLLDGEPMHVLPNRQYVIPFHAPHRLSNLGDTDLELIEIQTGTYFGEDDIVRLVDDYDRADFPAQQADDQELSEELPAEAPLSVEDGQQT